MRRLVINLIGFIALIEGLGRVEFMVLILVLALGILAIIGFDVLFRSLSSRAQ
jgi:hypothetical protein